MELLSQTRKTDRNRFTRMCIGESLIDLLQEHSFEEIKITDITKKAGVSRMTYYKYYESKQETLADYLEEIVGEYVTHTSRKEDIGQFHDYEHILYSLEFFHQYRHFMLSLVHANLYSIIIHAINTYMEEYVLPDFDGSIYELYYYSGALLNVFLTWEEKDSEKPAEEIAQIIHSFLHLG